MELIYIAGNGFSGSTLLDIVAGSSQDYFSIGELTYIARESLPEEKCSCGSKIKDCTFWTKVFKHWQSTSNISIKEYSRLRTKFEMNMSLPVVLWNLVVPSKAFQQYVASTRLLFTAIAEESKATYLIDSSKHPVRILILRKISRPRILHISRDFTGFLNSSKASYAIDIDNGVEVEIKPKRTVIRLVSWIYNNLLSKVLSIGLNYSIVKYRKFVADPGLLNQILPVANVQSTNLHPPHMMAGNRMRLSKNISVDKTIGNKNARLKSKELRLAKVIDKLFFFWS